jgi:hypothetical protein
MFGTVVDLQDIINSAKLHIDWSKGLMFGYSPKSACSHRKARSSLTTVLSVAALAGDEVQYANKCFPKSVSGILERWLHVMTIVMMVPCDDDDGYM